MRHLNTLPLILATALLTPAFAAVTPAPAPATLAPIKDLSPDPRQALVDETIAALMQRYQYERRPLDAALSQQVFTEYLKDLDGGRSYFLQSDIDSFTADRAQFGEDIKDGNLQPAFAVYNVFQRRVDERIHYALKLLQHEPDLTVTESYVYDRSKAPWAKDSAELDDLWRKRVKNDVIGLLLAGKTWPEAADTLHKRYQNYAYRTRQVSQTDVFALFMNAYAHAVDPHTDYFPPTQAEEFQIQMSLKLQGIGASLTSEGEYTRVDHLLPGGPADRDPLKQLHADDRITGVGQGLSGDVTDVIGWRLDDVVALIRGTPGSVVRLQVLPAGAPPGSPEKTVTLTRDTVQLEAQRAHQKVLNVTRGGKPYKVGVITVPGFYEDLEARQEGDKNYTSTTRDVRKLLGELTAQHVDGVVIDLRNNGGGSLSEAEQMVGLFVPSGPVVQVRRPDGDVQVDSSPDAPAVSYAGPLTVLVNRLTASASEIFAAAIQDYHRGLVVGSTTYGKGTVQQLTDLDRFIPNDDDAGQLKLTIEKFYRVTGSSTQDKGVSPDISLPALLDPSEVGEATNDSAMPWDEIKASDFAPLRSGLTTALPKLSQEHAARIAKDTDWQLFMQEVQQMNVERAETSVSLVLAQRQKERTEDDAKRLAVANAWRKLKGLGPAATLEDALKPPKPAAAASSAAPAVAGSDDGIQPDVLLNETAAIVADMSAAGLSATPGVAVADRD